MKTVINDLIKYRTNVSTVNLSQKFVIGMPFLYLSLFISVKKKIPSIDEPQIVSVNVLNDVVVYMIAFGVQQFQIK